MTFTRMLEWVGGTPAQATAEFEMFLDAEVEPDRAETVEDPRELLRAQMQAAGTDATAHAFAGAAR